jgi:hypothetical protein
LETDGFPLRGNEGLKVEIKVYSHEEYAYHPKNMAILYPYLDGNEIDKASL